LTLNPNGSEDHKLKIKGLDDIKVGDFRRKELDPGNGLGSLIAVDVAAVEAVQLKLEQRVAKVKSKKTESSDDEEEHEGVFTLRRMGTRSQTRVNRYYAAEEAEEGPDVDGTVAPMLILTMNPLNLTPLMMKSITSQPTEIQI
jgi:hypothetical protein